MRSLVAALALSFLLGCWAPAGFPNGNSFVIENVHVFDGRKDLGVTRVAVRDGRILAVGGAVAKNDLPAIDGAGRTLIPALIDANTLSTGRAREDALRFGVATELELLGSVAKLVQLKKERESMSRTRRADLFSAGAVTEPAHGHGSQSLLPIPQEAREAAAAAVVDSRIAAGSDFIKLILEDFSKVGGPDGQAILDPAQLAAAVNAVHRHGRLAVVSLAIHDEARQAVEAGVDGLAGSFLDRPADAEFVAAVRERGVFIIPTLAGVAALAGRGDGARLLAQPSLRQRLSSEQAADLGETFEDLESKMPAFWDYAIASVRSLKEAGVTILAGSGAPNPGSAHGIGLHLELELLVAAGLSPAEALEAATAATAESFALKDRGRIAPGWRADLLMVAGDPTRDIAATREIVAVFKNGFAIPLQ